MKLKQFQRGKYAKQYLEDQGLYGEVKDNLVYAKDVKQVLNYVEKGNEMGFVYETDLYTDKKKTDKVNEIKEAKLKNQSLTKQVLLQIRNLQRVDGFLKI